MRKPKVKPCPECDRTDAVVPILYGYPLGEAMKDAERNEIVLGGCMVSDEDPSLFCRRCQVPFEVVKRLA